MNRSLSVDLNLSLSGQIGGAGLAEGDFEGVSALTGKAHEALLADRKASKLGFLELAGNADLVTRCEQLAAEMTWAENLIVLGIGGSSLGPKALFSALQHPFHNVIPAKSRNGKPRIFFPDNSDPATFVSLLDSVDLTKTAVVAITKSGGTAETWAQLLILRERLTALSGEGAWRKQVIAITDPEHGALRAVAKSTGLRTLEVPQNVGGRFSVLSAVGLFPAAVWGSDVRGLMAGAARMQGACESHDVRKNPAYALATLLYLMDTQKGRGIHVLMPYADALRETADWYVQLWAESLGKKRGDVHVGPTPMRAVGATDQHSLLQLLMEGPQDKVTIFIAVDESQTDVTIPSAFPEHSEVKYLGGHTMGQLLRAEQKSTAAALAAAGRPSVTLRMPRIDAGTVGELMMLWEMATAFAGMLYGVNPYDQPGVESGKKYASGLLGRAGSEAYKQELEARPALNTAWVI